MKKLNVLIVDGDRKEREEYTRVLSDAGYAVHCAASCSEALGLVVKLRGRVVVLSELAAGGVSGISLLKDSLRKYPRLPFTFLALEPPLEAVIEALKHGAYDFLRKPVPPEALRESAARSMQRLELMLEEERREKAARKSRSVNRKELEAAQTLSSFKGFMISMAAHDFRSIVTVLDGYLQFLTDKCIGCPVTAPDGIVRQAGRTVGRLRAMANTLLDYEAAEAGKMCLDIRPFPLKELLAECAEFYAPYAEQKRIRLSVEWEGAEIRVKADRDKVMEILDNLLYNALKFTPACGSIRVSGGGLQDGNAATVLVRDTGPGIPKERLRRIFDWRNMVAILDSHARLGLGLTICKSLVEAQRGRIWIESVPGEGTTVFFSLPVSDLP
jgi:signal transduction histidine kinase